MCNLILLVYYHYLADRERLSVVNRLHMALDREYIEFIDTYLICGER